MTKPVLNIRDSRILHLLAEGCGRRRVVEVGVYRGEWTAEDVDRVAATYPDRLPQPPSASPRRAPTSPQLRVVSTAWEPPVFNGEPAVAVLSGREVEVLEALCDGLTNRAIAERLSRSEDTVKSHVRRIMAAVGARDRTHAVALVLTGAVRVHHGTRRGRP